MDRVVKMTMTVRMADDRQRHTRLQKEKNKTMREIIRECGGNTVSANLKVVHIGPKHVHIGHILVQTTPTIG